MVTTSTHLAESFRQLVDADELLQRHIIGCVSAYVAHHSSADGVVDAVHSTAALDAVPRWCRPEGFPPLPHTVDERTSTLEPLQPMEPVELLLMLDVMKVAHRSPSLCQSFFLTAAPSIEASASAAVAAWLSCYVTSFMERSRAEGDVPGVCLGGHLQFLPWPSLWCAAVLHKQLIFQVRILPLRIPSLYATVTSGAGAPMSCGHLCSARSAPLDAENSSVLHFGELDVCREGSGFISASCAEVEGLPPATPSSTLSRGCTYPSDGFLETLHTVSMIGVVHQVFYDGHSASSPAPWVTLLLLPMAASPHRFASTKCDRRLPKRRQVDLGILGLPQRNALAVIGGVIMVRGHTRVAGCRIGTRSEGAVPLRLGGVAEAPLEEYIIATWATPVQLLTGVLRLTGLSWLRASTADDTAGGTADTSLLATTVELNRLWLESTLASPLYPSSCSGVAGVGCSKHSDHASLPLTPTEEEAAARAALMCWEGVRLALGIESLREGSDRDVEAIMVTHFFSVSLDFLVASQLALVSAQLTDGVVVLTVDEAAPESLLTRLARRLDQVAPSAILEVPASILSCAKPSFFLPSYHTKRVTLPPTLIANTSASAVCAVSGESMGRPTARQSSHRHMHAGGTVTALQHPCYPEIIQGGALTQANSRTLVLQCIEAIPAPTLKLLQEALCDEASDAGDVPTRDSAESEGAFGPFDGVSSSYLPRQRLGKIEPAPYTNSAGATRRLVRREGGQSVKYCATRSALCSVRNGASLMQKSRLVEFAERCDVVVRPAYDTRRQMAALQGSTVPAFCQLFHSRGEAWLELMGAALMLPFRRVVDDVPSPNPVCTEPNYSSSDAPTVSEACSELLSTYFIAAKALCVEGADASMMKTLVKLTVAHTEWRTRLTEALQENAEGAMTRCSSSCAATALIDAVVAVGLCDATLHFFTAKTPVGECIFRILESEGWPTLTSHGSNDHLPQHHMPHSAYDTDGEASLHAESGEPPDWLRLYAEVEHRTRLVPASIPEAEPQPHAFSILQLVQDMQEHLRRTVQQGYNAGPPTQGNT